VRLGENQVIHENTISTLPR